MNVLISVISFGTHGTDLHSREARCSQGTPVDINVTTGIGHSMGRAAHTILAPMSAPIVIARINDYVSRFLEAALRRNETISNLLPQNYSEYGMSCDLNPRSA